MATGRMWLSVWALLAAEQLLHSVVCGYDGNEVAFDANGCVLPYSGTLPDLYPVKTYPTFGTTWNVTYHNTYKVLYAGCTNGKNCSQAFVLYQCGTIPPSVAGARAIQIPVSKVAVADTPVLTFLELIGSRTAIRAIVDISYVSSMCIRRMFSLGMINISFDQATWGLNYVDLASQGYTVAFTSSYLPVSDPAVLFREDKETSALGIMEYVLFTALFFNREVVAQQSFRDIQLRMNCHQALVANAPKVKAVFLGYANAYGSYWVKPQGCPNYYCDLFSYLPPAIAMLHWWIFSLEYKTNQLSCASNSL
eukprot:RCo046308